MNDELPFSEISQIIWKTAVANVPNDLHWRVIPQKDEHTPWGIGPETQVEYRSFRQNTTGPFRDRFQMIFNGSSLQSGAVDK